MSGIVFEKKINISQLVGLVVLIVTGIVGYVNLRSDVKVHDQDIILLKVEKLNKELYERDMEVLDEVVVELKKLNDKVTEIRIKLGQ